MKTTTVIDSLGSSIANGQILYTSPSIDVGGASVTFKYEWAPESNGTYTAEGGVSSGSSKAFSTGQGVGLNIGYSGLSAGLYANESKQDGGTSTLVDTDRSAATWFVNYTAGPMSIGYQVGATERGVAGAADSNTTTAKTLAAATGNFEFEMISLALNVNDSFSVSYGDLTETYDAQDDGTVADVDMSSTSIQFAYTLGSMSVKGYQTDTDNPGRDSNTKLCLRGRPRNLRALFLSRMSIPPSKRTYLASMELADIQL
jgi:hypothetical protein